jgi:hypothetical protein
MTYNFESGMKEMKNCRTGMRSDEMWWDVMRYEGKLIEMTWDDMTWHDMKWHDMTWNGMEWNDRKVNRSEQEWTGVNRSDMEWNGVTWSEVEKIEKQECECRLNQDIELNNEKQSNKKCEVCNESKKALSSNGKTHRCSRCNSGSIPDDAYFWGFMIYDIWYLISDIWLMISDIWYMIYDIWYMTYDILCTVYDIWFMMHDSWLMTCHGWPTM